MKKSFSIILLLAVLLGVLSLSSCANPDQPLRLGLGVYNNYGAMTDADGEKNGQAQITTTVAAVLLDRKGRIVKCEIDCIDSNLSITPEGEFAPPVEFQTKDELKEAYGMKAWANTREWYEQANSFESVVIGKTLDHLALLLTEDGKATEAVTSAGCTIAINEFMYALEDAVKNATECNAVYSNTLKVGIATTSTPTASEYETTLGSSIFAVATDDNGKVTAISGDKYSRVLTTDASGKSLTDTTQPIKTLKELGDVGNLNAFISSCLGKTSDEISALTANSEFIAAAAKAAKQKTN